MKPTDHRARIPNFFGALGYFSIAMQWLWALVIIAYPLLTNADLYRQRVTPTQPTPSLTFMFSPQIGLIIAGIITVIMVIVSIAAVVSAPKTITKTTANATYATARTLAPLIAPQPSATKKHRAMSAQTLLGVKIAAWLVPLLAVYFAPQNAPLPYEAVSAMALICAAATAVNLGLQYGLARLLHVPARQLR